MPRARFSTACSAATKRLVALEVTEERLRLSRKPVGRYFWRFGPSAVSMLANELVLREPLECILAKKPRMSGTADWSRPVAAEELIPARWVIRLVTEFCCPPNTMGKKRLARSLTVLEGPEEPRVDRLLRMFCPEEPLTRLRI
jgi:hypothetical protein